jgi:LysR family transcriptional regulator, nitrogen assimilation regulatory protein
MDFRRLRTFDRPVSTATVAVTALLREEVATCRKEGVWDIKLS